MGSDHALWARPATPRISLALVVTGAIAFLTGSILGSYFAAVAAAIGAALTWRFGPLIGGVVVGALSAVVVMTDPTIVHPMPGKYIAWTIGLMVIGMATGMVARRDSHRAESVDRDTPPERPIPGRGRATPMRGSRPVTGEMPRLRSKPEIPALKLRSDPEIPAFKPPARSTVERTAEAEAFPDLVVPPATSEMGMVDVERDVVARFLRDVRDALGADEVALWQHFEETDEVKPYAAAVSAPEALALQTKPPVETLVHTASLGGIGTNYDNELNWFYAVAAGAEGRFHGALGVYVEDGQAFPRERAKQALPGFVAQLAELLHLLYDGREARRLRGKVEAVESAIERIQAQQDMKGLQEEICRSALAVCGASRAAFVGYDKGSEAFRPMHVEPAVALPSSIAANSLVGSFLTPGKSTSGRENFHATRQPLFTGGESFPRPGSAGVVGLEHDGDLVGSIVVTGDKAGQVTVVELNLLRSLARRAAAQVVAVRQLEEAKGQATKDALTGLANRHAFDERIRSVMAAADRYGHKTSLVLADVDKFKNINDTYGHVAGDEVLRQLGKTLMVAVREMDFVARYGGEEIAIVMPQTGGEWAHRAADRLRQAVEKMTVVFEGKRIPVTASFGVASHPESGYNQEDLFKAADEALYEAKHAGRNCVKFAIRKPKEAES